jgi:hypothetical protein
MSDVKAMVGGHDLADASDDETKQFEKELAGDTKKPESSDDHDDHDDGDDKASDSDDRSTKVDSELEEAASDSERDEIRARRRNERLRRKQNQKERMDALLRQQDNLAAQNRRMAEQLARLQNNDSAVKLNNLDAAIKEAEQAQVQARAVLADATSKNDGPTAAQAMEFMLTARDRHTQLTAVKADVVNSQRAPSPIDPVVRKNASSFQAKNAWYKGPTSSDADSKIMTLLDNEVSREGFDPSTPTYWSELEARAKKYIPHRFDGGSTTDGETTYNSDNTPRRTPRSPVGGSGQGGNSTRDTEGGFKLSAERVKAMKEAGIWDDPTRRQKMIATYRENDKAST